MYFNNLDFLNLYHKLIEEYELKQLDYSSFKFYVSELKRFNNQITLYDGNTTSPINKGEKRIIIGTINKKILLKLMTNFFNNKELQVISLYIFLIAIIDYDFIDKISLNIRFLDEKLNDIRIDICSKSILYIDFKNKTIDIRHNEFPFKILTTENFEDSTLYNRHLDIFKHLINSEIIYSETFDYNKNFSYEEILNYKKIKTMINH